MNLRLPEELDSHQLSSESELINKLLRVKRVIESINEYLSINWLMPYDYRIKISVLNNETIIDKSIITSINLPNNTIISSLILVDENNSRIPFSVSWSNEQERKGELIFQSSAKALNNPSYYLYYSTTPSKTLVSNNDLMYQINGDNNSFTIRTNSYFVEVNNGFITMLNNSGTNNYLTNFNTFFNCNGINYYQVNNEVTLKKHAYFAEAIIKGYHSTNDSFIIRELFTPDRIIIIDKTTIASNSYCSYNYLLSTNKSLINSYLDENNNISPVTNHDWQLMGNSSWVELHSNFGVGLTTSDKHLIESMVNDSDNAIKVALMNQSPISKGSYYNIINIIPTFNLRLNETRESVIDKTTISNQSLNNLINDIKSFANNYFYEDNLIVLLNYSISIADKFFTNNADLIESQLITNKPFKLSNGLTLNSQASTNYLLNSSFNNLTGNNSFWIFSINNSLLININTVNPVNVTLVNPNNISSNYYSINGLTINSDNGSGFYRLIVNGTNYSIITTAPKLVSITPTTINSNKTLYLIVNKDSLNITINNSGSQTFELFNPINESIAELTLNSESGNISPTINPCWTNCYYRLTINNNSPFTINSSNNYLTQSINYGINPNKPEITAIISSDIPQGIININNENNSFNTDLVINDFVINNSYYSFNLSEPSLTYKGVKWFNKWLSCHNECSTNFSSLRLIELGSNRITVFANTTTGINYLFQFYAYKPFFKVTVNGLKPYYFGPEWNINGSNKYYSINDVTKRINEDITLNLFNLSGPQSIIGKSDDYCSGKVLFNTNLLCRDNSVLINNSIIRFKSCLDGDYWFLINSDKPIINNYVNQFLLKFNFNISNPIINVNGSLN